MDSITIKDNFSRRAGTYDNYSPAQQLAARRLSGLLPLTGISSVIELGCGSGYYTAILKKRYPRAYLCAGDISAAMLKAAAARLRDNTIDLVLQDMHRVSTDKKFDLVTANACLHWSDDIDAVLRNCRALSREGAALAVSCFGPQTFYEMGASLKRLLPGAQIAAESFLPKDQLAVRLEKYFKAVRIEEYTHRENFPSLRDLLRLVRLSGVRGEGLKSGYLTPRRVKDWEDAYRQMFGAITASYEVFLCWATS